METARKLGLYVSYYLSRFNRQAYKNLGYGTQLKTHKKIGGILNINPNTIKNWRDEFDPIFSHRVGWYQKPMIPTRVNVVRALENLDEVHVRLIVKDILSGELLDDKNTLAQLTGIVTNTDNKKGKTRFILRAPTGKRAEEFFIAYHNEFSKPINGTLIDSRDLGTGYDFAIKTDKNKYFVEVKGISDYSGGILLTDKEWSVATTKKSKYYLCVISNLIEQPKILFIQNPAKKLTPQKNVYSTIQISWSISQKQLKQIND